MQIAWRWVSGVEVCESRAKGAKERPASKVNPFLNIFSNKCDYKYSGPSREMDKLRFNQVTLIKRRKSNELLRVDC